MLVGATYGEQMSIHPDDYHREYDSKPVKDVPLSTYHMRNVLQNLTPKCYDPQLLNEKLKEYRGSRLPEKRLLVGSAEATRSPHILLAALETKLVLM